MLLPDPSRRRGKRLAGILMQAGALALAGAGVAGCEGGITEAAPASRPTLDGRPTIVSLNPCSDAVLAQVSAPGQLLAISHYSRDRASSSMDLDEARRFRAVSGSVEEVAALAPDVVVTGAYFDPASAQALRDLGIRLVALPIPADIAESEAQVRSLAALTGHRAAGEAMVGRIEQALARYAPPDSHTSAGTEPTPALVWESGGIVAGDGTLIADLMRRTGFANGAAARGLAQADFLPLERVLADPPRVIFAVGDARAEADRMLRHPALARLPGVTRASLDPALLWCGGPTIPRVLARLAQVRRGLAP